MKRVRLNDRERIPDPESSWARRRRSGRIVDAPVATAADVKADAKVDARVDKSNGSVNPSIENIIPRWGQGRPPGSANYVTKALKAAVLDAGEEVGNPVTGEQGLKAYLTWLAVAHPHSYVALLRRMLPVRVTGDLDPQGLAARMLQVVAAQKTMVANGASNIINVTPTPTRSAADDP